ncbi:MULTISPECIES: hypothetical protein [unclassified Lysobacter]|uniref:hypothetical protein n=1 Tax=unclassified Lysobacter TaxID=2635362 RepID=UPI0007093A09|nr:MULTISPECIES: hypothetical protein [unclassified Lysobacter]KRD38871.1 hypothetical protein ASE35_00340 [Lysobacter sp. Root916]KRD74981.1 hypothetical protein ASE43_17500 [Lysobacter sp. Root983]
MRHTPKSALQALLMLLMLALAPLVSADPVVANQKLQLAKLNFAQVQLQHQIGQMHASAGRINEARAAFAAANVNGQMLTVSLLQLKQENQLTYNNGQYINGPAQQRAVMQTELASINSQQLSIDFAVLQQQPTSQVYLSRAQIDLLMLTQSMLRVEQEMIAAQQ